MRSKSKNKHRNNLFKTFITYTVSILQIAYYIYNIFFK